MEDSYAPVPPEFQKKHRSIQPNSWNPWNGIYLALTDTTVTVSNSAERAERLRNAGDTTGVWPSRLVHIDSMASYERTEGNHYNGVKEPAFTTLSYKWGLWVRDGQSELDISGVDWSMPAIDPAYFTVDELTNVLQKMRRYTEWTWIDVACVNQYLNELTMRDIVIEPRNFRLAQQTFAWWVDFTSDVLEQLMNEVATCEVKLTAAMSAAQEEKDFDAVVPLLIELYGPLSTLIATPWFSSNWTLREIVLCKDIIILNREGDPIPLHEQSTKYADIGIIARACAAALAWLDRMEERIAQDESVRNQILAAPTHLPPSSTTQSISTIGDLIETYLDLVRAKSPFFLYASRPDVLYHWTMVLLKTGRLIIDDMAGTVPHSSTCEQIVYGGWGSSFYVDCCCYSTCACVGDARHAANGCPSGEPPILQRPWNAAPWCIPCILGISYPMVRNGPSVTVHTQIPHGTGWQDSSPGALSTTLSRVDPDSEINPYRDGSSIHETLDRSLQILQSLEPH